MTVYETIIVGGGPAGITAGIYLARKKVGFAMVTMDVGGQTLWTGDVGNYLGHQYITGPELAEKFAAHLREFDVELNEGEKVDRIVKSEGVFTVISDKKQYRAKTVIVCTGRKQKELSVPGEQEFKNKGVTYCAICDGPLFAGKDVAVIGGGNAGLEVVLQMVKIAEKVYLIEKLSRLAADRILTDKLAEYKNAEVLTGTVIARIYGDKMVSGVTVKNSGGTEKEIAVEGVLVEIGSVPNSGIVDGVVKNEYGEIIVDCAVKTSVPGLFAAGDVTNVFKKQIIIACGEGAKAAIAASEYLDFIK
jgi:alkyl hydroperoxide reductase subunit F